VSAPRATKGRLLRISEASPILNIPETTLRRLCASERVPSEKIGRCWFIKAAYIEAVTSWSGIPATAGSRP
jgi:hypothetical protein